MQVDVSQSIHLLLDLSVSVCVNACVTKEGKEEGKGKKEREREVHIRKEYSRIHDEVSHLKVMKKSLKRTQVYQ